MVNKNTITYGIGLTKKKEMSTTEKTEGQWSKEKAKTE